MARTGIVATAGAEGAAALEAGLWRIATVLLEGSLLEGERALQQVLREVGSAVASVVLAARAAAALGRTGARAHGGGLGRGVPLCAAHVPP
jgi:hypothetical protein